MSKVVVPEIVSPYKSIKSTYGTLLESVNYSYILYSESDIILRNEPFKERNCYYDVLVRSEFPTKCNIICKPTRYDLSWEDTESIFHIFTELGIISSDLMPFKDGDKICLNIKPDKNHTKISVFAALCLYRWCDTSPDFIYEILYLHKKMPSISIWQIIYYTCCRYVQNSNHNFLAIGYANGTLLSTVIKLFHVPKMFKAAYFFNNKAKYLSLMQQNLSVPYNRFELPAEFNSKVFNINSLEDLLSENWTPYYDLCRCDI